MEEKNSYKKIEKKLNEQQLGIETLDNDNNSLERLVAVFNKIDSDFLTPQQPEVDLVTYSKKLIKNAYNFVLIENENDIGLISLYANDFVNKICFINAIGILPSYQGKHVGILISEFIIEFAKEMNFDLIKSHIAKNNYISQGLVAKFNMKIESEVNEKTYLMVKDLREN